MQNKKRVFDGNKGVNISNGSARMRGRKNRATRSHAVRNTPDCSGYPTERLFQISF